MAALALAVSPVYAIYSGFIMTEVPMLVALIASALILWKPSDRHPLWQRYRGRNTFWPCGRHPGAGADAGRRLSVDSLQRGGSNSCRLRSTLWFGIAAAIVILAPAVAFYLYDPAGFVERTKTWLHAIPMGSVQFRNNMEASLLFHFRDLPRRLAGRRRRRDPQSIHEKNAPDSVEQDAPAHSNPASDLGNSLLPGIAYRHSLARCGCADASALCAHSPACFGDSLRIVVQTLGPLQARARGVGYVQVLFFGVAMAAFSPYRQTQTEKMEFARLMRDSIPGPALMIAGNYSPILDYYRGIGVRPEWQIVWSGWDWNARAVEARVGESWNNRVPVYRSTDPPGWSYFERELLETYFILKDCRKERIAPHLYQRFFRSTDRLLLLWIIRYAAR